MTRIAVSDGMITETVIATTRCFEFIKHLEQHVAVGLWSLISNNFVSIAIMVVLFVTMIWMAIFSAKVLKQAKSYYQKDLGDESN